MKRKFCGRFPEKGKWKWWQLLLFRFFCVWCAFDMLIFPIFSTVFSLLKKRGKRKKERRKKLSEEMNAQEMSHMTGSGERNGRIQDIWVVWQHVANLYSSPYGKYVRDTLNYIVLVILHYALCLSPSTIAFSSFEWAILIFFVGRYLVEGQQIWDIMQYIKKRKQNGDAGYKLKWIRLKMFSIYFSDPWNLLDFISLLVYLVIFILRVTTLLISGSEMNNRALAIAGYLYSLNTLCLTLRAFGYVAEQSRHLGVIQIALFGIINDMATIILQFVASILAFSIAITKVYMAEQSFIANGNVRNDNTCRSSGLSCWWVMVSHLAWSLLGVQEESDPMSSVDVPSEHIARILYAAFCIFAVILLLNMLIALLSNTYQRTEEKSFKIWSIKRAVTIQTYDAYDPVPVPLNIVYNIGKLLRLVKRKDKTQVLWIKKSLSRQVIQKLEREYFAKNANLFPLTDMDKNDRLLHETDKNRQMVSQVLCTTFTSQGCEQGELCVGPEMWKVHPGIRIEGLLLTCECKERCARTDIQCRHGARYRKHFSAEFPHFEVVILETGERWVGIGAVDEDYDTSKMPGWNIESVGYHTDDGKIFHNEGSKETKGPVMARRGDRIRCTVLFGDEKDEKVQVSVMFSLNGRIIITKEREDQFFMDSDKQLYPYVCMLHGGSVLAKMCPREVVVTKSSEDTNRKLEELAKDVKKYKDETNQKLDALLARLTDNQKDQQRARTASANF